MTIFSLQLLHILNDGFRAGLTLLLPFIAHDFKINLTTVGFLGSSLSILEIILAVPAGLLAVKYGGSRLLGIALVIYSLGFLFSFLSFNFYFVILTFVVAGIGFALFHPVAFAVVTKLHHKKERGRGLGNFTAIGDVGRIGIASLITFVITYIGWRRTSLISFLFLFLIFVFYAKSLFKKENKTSDSIGEKDTLRHRDILKNKRFIFASMSFAIDSFASATLFIFIPFLLLKRGVAPQFLGAMTATFFVGNLFGKTILGRFADKFGNINVFMISEILMALFILILSNSTFLPMIILSSILLGAFTKGTSPVLISMVSESVEHHGRYEKAFGLNALNVGIAAAIGPLVLGYLADKYGIVAAFNFAAFTSLLAILPAFVFRKLSIH